MTLDGGRSPDSESPDPISCESISRCIERSLPVAISAVDMSGTQIYVNDAFVRLVGWKREELVGARPPFVYWAEDHRHAILEMLAATLDGHTPSDGSNLLLQRRDGERFTLRVRVTPLRGDSGSQVGWLARWSHPHSGDVFEEHSCTMVDATRGSSEGIAITDAAGRFVFVNPAFANVCGWTGEELLGRSWAALQAQDEGRPVDADRDTRVRAGGTLIREIDVRRSDGSVIPIDWRITGLLQRGRFIGTIAHVRDLTEERRTAGELVRLRRAVEATSEVVFITEPDGTFAWVNPEFTRLYGYAPSEVVGKATPRILKSPAAPKEQAVGLWRAILAGQTVRTEYQNQRRTGQPVWVDACVSPIAEEGGRVTGFLAIQRDVSERRHLTDQLVQAQKMEAVGRLAGGIAHDFNNVLTVISGFTDLLLADTPEGSSAAADLREIHLAAERAAGMTRQLLGFSRREAPTHAVIDVNAVVASVEKLVRRAIGEDVTLLFDTWDAPLRVQADPAEVTQLILNLAVNSRDAMPSGGSLTVVVERIDVGPERLVHDVAPGPYAAILVADTGCGMQPDVVARAFDPFFTTKGVGQGTGLGLSIVYGVVKRMGGHVAIDSTPGCGTTVAIYVPLVAGAEAAAVPPGDAQPAPGRGEVILLVEDEDAVRAVAHRMLRHAGYHVIEARSAGEALLVFESRGDEIALLVTDVVMPQLSGTELATRLREQCPTLKTIFVTGYSSDAARDVMQDLGAPCLHKPFSPRDLLTMVRGVLDAA